MTSPSIPVAALVRRAFLHVVAAFAACAVLLCLSAASAWAAPAPAGPFQVDGPATAYSWDGSTLLISGEGVTVAGMADPGGAACGDVRVASGVTGVAVGSNVRIGTLDVGRTAAFSLAGDGNTVDVWKSARGDSVNGTGSITVASAEAPLDIHESAVLHLTGTAYGVSVWEQGRLAVGPAAQIGFATVYDGTLDLSQVAVGSPVSIGGLGVGTYSAGAFVVAPFGATDLSQLVSTSSLLVHQDATPVFEAGEQVGVMRRDGSFDITAMRTVTFEGFAGQVLQVQQVRLFGAAVAPEVPVPDSCRFAGWDRAFDYVTQDMTVAARFEQLPASGGNAVAGPPDAALPSGGIPAARLAATGDGTPVGPVAAAGTAAVVVAVAALAAARRHRRS